MTLFCDFFYVFWETVVPLQAVQSPKPQSWRRPWGKFPQNNILTIFFRQFLKHLFQDVPLWMLANETE
jgi:hypothetical protein